MVALATIVTTKSGEEATIWRLWRNVRHVPRLSGGL
jgi:hypothetical protein